MERKALVVCALVGFLGVLSAALGFAAEGTRVKVRTPEAMSSTCSPETAPFALLVDAVMRCPVN